MEHCQTETTLDWSSNPLNKADTSNYMIRAKTGFWFVQPMLNLEYAITQFSMIRASVGYNLSFSDSWTIDRNATLSNVPTGINPNGLNVQVGIFLGVFGY